MLNDINEHILIIKINIQLVQGAVSPPLLNL